MCVCVKERQRERKKKREFQSACIFLRSYHLSSQPNLLGL